MNNIVIEKLNKADLIEAISIYDENCDTKSLINKIEKMIYVFN